MNAYERIMEAAAEARADGMAQRRDRPSQRRCAEEPSSKPLAIVRAQRMELREPAEGDEFLHFQGFASVYNAPYEMWDMFGPYTEQVMAGAGAVTLARDDLDVPFVLQHQALRRIARTTNDTLTLAELEEDGDEGLHVDAPKLDPNDRDVDYIAPKLRSGLIDEMSFRFRIMAGSWSPDWMEYHIDEYDIHRGDVAIVGYGANPHTQGAGLRSGQMPALVDMSEGQLRQLERDLRTERSRRSPSSMTLDDLLRNSREVAIDPVY